MKTFRQHLKNKLKDKEFKALNEEERQLLDIALQISTVQKK